MAMDESVVLGRAGRYSILALATLLASVTGAAAQNSEAASTVPAVEAIAPAAENSAADDDETTAQAAEPLSEEETAALRNALNSKFDSEAAAAVTTRSVRPSGGPGLDWDRTTKPDGATYTVKRTLPVDWNAKIGADLGVNNTSALPDPEPSVLAPPAKNTGAAWANVQVPGVASFDARVAAGTEPNKFGVSRTVPLGGASLTLQDSYALAEPSPASPTGITPPGAAPVWSNDRQAKLSITATGTTFGVGSTSTTADRVTHNRFSAEQKLFDKFNVTTTVSDVGAPTSNKGITAGFKTQW
jgi:hypothetical protein